MKPWIILLLVGIAIGLVAIPVGLDSFSGLRTRWALASVANLVEQDVDAAERELEKVASRLPDPSKDRDYWIIRQRIALARDDADDAVEVAESALRAIPDFRLIANLAYRHFYEKMEYESALRLLLVYYSRPDGSDARFPNELNEIAYLRSLALVDLDKGLKEINAALKIYPETGAFLDTRAWILFQMGRLPEALIDANAAVKLATQEYESYQRNFQVRLARWFNGKSIPSSPDGRFTQFETDPALWQLAAVRFHRAKILEGLGRGDEAQKDWDWLDQHRLPRDDRVQ